MCHVKLILPSRKEEDHLEPPKTKLLRKKKDLEVIRSPKEIIQSPKQSKRPIMTNNTKTSDLKTNKKIKMEELSSREINLPCSVRPISSAMTYTNYMDPNIMITPSQAPVDINWDYNSLIENNPSVSLFQNDHYFFSNASNFNSDRNSFEIKVETLDFDHLNTFLVNPEDLFY